MQIYSHGCTLDCFGCCKFNEKVVEPADELIDEYWFFQELAGRMGIEGYPMVTKQDYLDRVIQPLKARGIDLDRIKHEAVTVQKEPVAWSDLNFQTPSGKIEDTGSLI